MLRPQRKISGARPGAGRGAGASGAARPVLATSPRDDLVVARIGHPEPDSPVRTASSSERPVEPSVQDSGGRSVLRGRKVVVFDAFYSAKHGSSA